MCKLALHTCDRGDASDYSTLGLQNPGMEVKPISRITPRRYLQHMEEAAAKSIFTLCIKPVADPKATDNG